jgi:hypothetical protein
MTNKLPYEIVALEASKLIVRMALSNYSDYYDNHRLYLGFIEACGWTNTEYDEETMVRIDHAWDFYLKNKSIVWN